MAGSRFPAMMICPPRWASSAAGTRSINGVLWHEMWDKTIKENVGEVGQNKINLPRRCNRTPSAAPTRAPSSDTGPPPLRQLGRPSPLPMPTHTVANRHACCRSWMPLIGLVQLQRALGGATPPFDPIPPGGRGVARNAPVLGDKETGARRQCLDDPGIAERGWKSPRWAARESRTAAPDDGC